MTRFRNPAHVWHRRLPTDPVLARSAHITAGVRIRRRDWRLRRVLRRAGACTLPALLLEGSAARRSAGVC